MPEPLAIPESVTVLSNSSKFTLDALGLDSAARGWERRDRRARVRDGAPSAGEVGSLRSDPARADGDRRQGNASRAEAGGEDQAAGAQAQAQACESEWEAEAGRRRRGGGGAEGPGFALLRLVVALSTRLADAMAELRDRCAIQTADDGLVLTL